MFEGVLEQYTKVRMKLQVKSMLHWTFRYSILNHSSGI